MTKTKIYDYDNNIEYIDLPDTEISSIFVVVLSGDETGTVKFKDGSDLDFDASDSRIEDLYDGHYIVTGEAIKKWLEFVPTDGRTASYERQNIFSGGGA